MEGNALSAWFGFLHDGRCKGLQQGGHMEDPVFKKSKIKNLCMLKKNYSVKNAGF